MFITAVCPTYRHPELLANSLALFQLQKHRDKYLVILDDGGTFDNQEGENWKVVSVPERYAALDVKHNALLDHLPADTDAIAVWDDDDIYLPHHLAAHARALERGSYSHPVHVYSDYTGEVLLEPARWRFHGCIAARIELVRQIDGWPTDGRPDFDQQFIGRLQRAGVTADPTPANPSYIYRWRHEHGHSSSDVRHGDDNAWYDRIPDRYREPGRLGALAPQLDLFTLHCLTNYSLPGDYHALESATPTH
jgi:glycosyltransferase involved in cell wall biosynthesis